MSRIISFTTLIVLLSAMFASAQTVVLINGVPTKVKLDGKQIVSIIGPADGHMNGYPISATQIPYTDPGLDKINGTGVLDETTTSPVAAVSSAPTATAPSATTAAPSATTAAPSATTVTAAPSSDSTNNGNSPVKPKALAGNYFKFDRNSALLSELAINEIKDYADKITNGTSSSVTLQAFYRTNSKRSEQLIKNRLDACQKYFELNGVAKSAINVEMVAEAKQSDKVSVIIQ